MTDQETKEALALYEVDRFLEENREKTPAGPLVFKLLSVYSGCSKKTERLFRLALYSINAEQGSPGFQDPMESSEEALEKVVQSVKEESRALYDLKELTCAQMLQNTLQKIDLLKALLNLKKRNKEAS